VLADGRIYITSEDGVTSVMKAGPSFEVVAENELDDYTLSSPAISTQRSTRSTSSSRNARHRIHTDRHLPRSRQRTGCSRNAG